jgi:hypothetical protein
VTCARAHAISALRMHALVPRRREEGCQTAVTDPLLVVVGERQAGPPHESTMKLTHQQLLSPSRPRPIPSPPCTAVSLDIDEIVSTLDVAALQAHLGCGCRSHFHSPPQPKPQSKLPHLHAHPQPLVDQINQQHRMLMTDARSPLQPPPQSKSVHVHVHPQPHLWIESGILIEHPHSNLTPALYPL